VIPEKTTMSIPMARKRLADQIRAAIETDNDRSPNNMEELDLLAEQWEAIPEAREDRLLDNAYHSFLHFLSDRDIRSRDPQYAETQISEMRQLIEKLERPPSIDQM
jgi:cupin superfamily acireductone dioxygenase involved in methionine salvage